MTFYVSDVLKNTVTKDDLIDNQSKEKISLPCIYADIKIDKKNIYLDVEKLEFKKTKVILKLITPSNLINLALRVENWDILSIKTNDNLENTNYPSFLISKNHNIRIKKIQKSLSGYNYTITIIIDKD